MQHLPTYLEELYNLPKSQIQKEENIKTFNITRFNHFFPIPWDIYRENRYDMVIYGYGAEIFYNQKINILGLINSGSPIVIDMIFKNEKSYKHFIRDIDKSYHLFSVSYSQDKILYEYSYRGDSSRKIKFTVLRYGYKNISEVLDFIKLFDLNKSKVVLHADALSGPPKFFKLFDYDKPLTIYTDITDKYRIGKIINRYGDSIKFKFYSPKNKSTGVVFNPGIFKKLSQYSDNKLKGHNWKIESLHSNITSLNKQIVICLSKGI